MEGENYHRLKVRPYQKSASFMLFFWVLLLHFFHLFHIVSLDKHDTYSLHHLYWFVCRHFLFFHLLDNFFKLLFWSSRPFFFPCSFLFYTTRRMNRISYYQHLRRYILHTSSFNDVILLIFTNDVSLILMHPKKI